MGEFEGRTIFITGASLGVGKACAQQFHRLGANVVLNARRAEPLEAAAAELGDADRILTVAADVADLDAMEDALQLTVDRFGSLDGLVNNAGVHHRGPVSDVDPRRLAQMVAVNLGAPIALTRMALPHLRSAAATGGPKRFVVQVASLAGTIPIDGAATYSATKFGLRTFSFALAEELRDEPVTISVVSPGPIDTGFIMDQIEDVSDLTFSQPICTAEHVAEMVVASARDGRRERQWPESGGTMGTLGYLFPSLRRMLKPVLMRRGRRRKEALIAARDGHDG